MNKKIITLSLCVIGLTSYFPVQAQLSPVSLPPQPSAPYVKTPPVGSHWVIEFKAKTGEAKPAPDTAEKNREEEKYGPVRLEIWLGKNGTTRGELTDSAGKKTEYYVVENILLQSSGESVVSMPPADDGKYEINNVRVKYFPGVFWLNAENYRGLEKIDGVECYKFQSAPTSSRQFKAWIRVADGFPQAIQFGAFTCQCSRIDSYPQEIQLPESFQKKLEQIQVQNKALELLQKLNES